MKNIMSLTKKAEAGGIDAILQLIHMFETGDGVEDDFNAADYWAGRLNGIEGESGESGESPKDSAKNNTSITVKILAGVLVVVIALFTVFAYKMYPAIKAYKALESGDYRTALEMFQEDIDVEGIARDYFRSKAFSYLKDIESRYKNGEILDEEMKAEMRNLIQFGIDSITIEGQKYIDDIEGVEAAYQCVKDADFGSAIEMLQRIEPDSIKYSEAQTLLNDVVDDYEAIIIDAVGMPTGVEACSEALAVLNGAIEVVPNSDCIKSKLAEVVGTYEGAIYEVVESSLAKFDFDKADSCLTEAEALIGDSSAVSELRTMLNDKKPVAMGSLKIVDNYRFRSLDSDGQIDSFGNEFAGSNSFQMGENYSKEAFAAYDGGYSVIRGTISVSDRAGTGSIMEFCITDENGNELFSIDNLQRIVGPVEVLCDVSSAKRIILVMKASSGWITNELLLKDFYFYK